MASRQDEGRRVRIASYIKGALSEAATPLQSLRFLAAAWPIMRIYAIGEGPPRLPKS